MFLSDFLRENSVGFKHPVSNYHSLASHTLWLPHCYKWDWWGVQTGKHLMGFLCHCSDSQGRQFEGWTRLMERAALLLRAPGQGEILLINCWNKGGELALFQLQEKSEFPDYSQQTCGYYGIWYCICFWVILRKLCHLCFVSPWLTMIELRGHWTWASYLIDSDCNGNLLMFLFLPHFFIIYKMFINNNVKKILLKLLFEIKTFFLFCSFSDFSPWHYSLLNITV